MRRLVTVCFAALPALALSGWISIGAETELPVAPAATDVKTVEIVKEVRTTATRNLFILYMGGAKVHTMIAGFMGFAEAPQVIVVSEVK